MRKGWSLEGYMEKGGFAGSWGSLWLLCFPHEMEDRQLCPTYADAFRQPKSTSCPALGIRVSTLQWLTAERGNFAWLIQRKTLLKGFKALLLKCLQPLFIWHTPTPVWVEKNSSEAALQSPSDLLSCLSLLRAFKVSLFGNSRFRAGAQGTHSRQFLLSPVHSSSVQHSQLARQHWGPYIHTTDSYCILLSWKYVSSYHRLRAHS